jgi:hypothetical protein
MYAEPAIRRFVNDLRDPRCIPAVDAPEIAALEGERARLVAALDEAGHRYGGNLDMSHYIAQRAKAIREGTELPPEPPTFAERESANEKRRRNVAAAENALLAFADTICETVRHHPEWQDEARERVAAAQAEAEAARRAAQDAFRRAEEAQHLVIHLQRVAADELYPSTSGTFPRDAPDLIWSVTDPHVLDLMALSRTGSPL